MSQTIYTDTNILNEDCDLSSSVTNHYVKSTVGKLYDFNEFTFTNCGATGYLGPTYYQMLSSYSSTPWTRNNLNLNMINTGIQLWTVPETKMYKIVCAGAGSVTSTSQDTIKNGYGVVLNIASYKLTAGNVISILIGQIGSNYAGGGGTFISVDNTPLFCAAGAGGIGNQAGTNGNVDGSIQTNGRNAYASAGGAGGAGGNGGTGNTSTGGGGGAGGGFFRSGTKGTSLADPGAGFLQNGMGGSGSGTDNGGFGGGGGGGGGQAGAGGGGYSGGGPGFRSGSGAGGGGGGSYDITGIYNGSATNTGMGYVVITKL